MSLVVAALRAAARDGHTVLPRDVLAAVLAGRGAAFDPADRAGIVEPGGDLVALPDLAAAEESVAAALLGLADEGRLRILDGIVDGTGEPSDTYVVRDADALDLAGAERALRGAPDSSTVTVVGDGGLPPPAGAGRFFLDLLAAAGALGVPVNRPDGGVGSPLARLARDVREGRLQPVDDPTREVVVVPASDGVVAAHRAAQLVNDSIPRVFGLPAASIAVVTPLRRGPAGAEALRAAGLPARTVREALPERWPAVVAVVPPEACGLLSRPAVYAMFSRATRHLSVVHAAGPALAHAVARVPARPRRTRLPGLLGVAG